MNIESTTDLAVANTILEQLGGSRVLDLMIGVKHLRGTNKALDVRFKARSLKGINHIKITLTPMDEYHVEFYSVRGISVKQIEESDGIQAEGMIDYIERTTGLALRLPRIRFVR